MGKLKLTIHPLFFIFGLYFAVTGKVFSFLNFTLVACIHELGHYFSSSRQGYELNKITLMPYGAVIRGESQSFSYTDEVLIALAGPAVNLTTAVFFVALWWLFPEVYPYTELAVTASVTIALINMLPAFPLDGGRVFLAALSIYIPRKRALKIAKSVGISASIAVFAIFIYSIFTNFNLSVLFFSLFMLFGNVFVSKDNDYVRAYSALSLKNLKKGRAIKRVAVSDKTLVKDLFRFISGGTLIDVEILGTDRKTTLSCDKTLKLLLEGDVYSTVSSEAERLFKPKKP